MSGIEFKTAIHLTPQKNAPDEHRPTTRFFKPLAVFVILASLHLYFYTHLPEPRRDGGWPSIVMRNWHETGYWPLHGQLVANPGGLEAGDEPFIYPGHRPTFLIAPYLLKELPGAAFRDGALYDFAVLAATYAAMLALFGCNWRGILLGSVVCFTPGFINNIAEIDTINIPALFGLAAMGYAASRFARHETDVSAYAIPVIVTLLFMCLNWSTLFPLGIAAVYVLCKRSDWKITALFFTPALIAGLLVLAIAMHSKHSSNTSTDSGEFWNAYLWGPLGYDHAGMTFGKALVRISAVNFMAWLSLGIAGLVVLLINGLGEKWRRAGWPLLAGIAAVFALRNYNAHHPWNAICNIGLGLLFSIELLTDRQSLAFPKWQRAATTATVAFAFLFAVAWMALDDFNNRGFNLLRGLVYQNTPRHALIVVDSLLPAGDPHLKEFSESFDRRLVALEGWDHQANGREVFVLTHTNLPEGATLVAQSHQALTGADKIIAPLFDFYRTKISRRAPGNRKEYFDDYQLGKF